MPTIIDGTTGVDQVQDGIITDAKIAAMAASKLTGRVPAANAPLGSVIQVVSVTKTDTYSVSLSGGAEDTNNFMSASITPSSANSKILVIVHATTSGPSDINYNALTLYRDSTQICLGDAAGVRARRATQGQSFTTDNNIVNNSSIVFTDSPATTSAITYGVRIAKADSLSGTLYVNRSVNDGDVVQRTRGTSTITLMEIAA
jgi:hypothetical protein